MYTRAKTAQVSGVLGNLQETVLACSTTGLLDAETNGHSPTLNTHCLQRSSLVLAAAIGFSRLLYPRHIQKSNFDSQSRPPSLQSRSLYFQPGVF
ncbi:hypothetical protein AAHC03_024530 [Spirometra sp. Aus1]